MIAFEQFHSSPVDYKEKILLLIKDLVSVRTCI
jgi:hypothetical protein